MRTIRATRPDGAPIYVILDDLSAHTNRRMKRWAAKNKVELCFTPSYASWVNPVEAHFGPLRQFTPADSHHPIHTVQPRAPHARLRWRNKNARHLDVLAVQQSQRPGLVWAWTAEKTFHAACGPGNLGEALAIFRTWATTSAP